ncbi:hypothetical protein COOONC_14296 [Cooperia oncophora]
MVLQEGSDAKETMETLTSSAREFLDLCDVEHEDGSGHSLEALSPSEIDKGSSDVVAVGARNPMESASTVEKTAPHSAGVPEQERGGFTAIRCEQISKNPSDSAGTSTVPETPESVVLETPPELYTAPVAHSTPRPCGGSIGFRIYPDEVPPSLAAATIELARKYFLR